MSVVRKDVLAYVISWSYPKVLAILYGSNFCIEAWAGIITERPALAISARG